MFHTPSFKKMDKKTKIIAEKHYLIRFGIVTLMVNKWSPRIDGLFNLGTPFFARTTTSPG